MDREKGALRLGLQLERTFGKRSTKNGTNRCIQVLICFCTDKKKGEVDYALVVSLQALESIDLFRIFKTQIFYFNAFRFKDG